LPAPLSVFRVAVDGDAYVPPVLGSIGGERDADRVECFVARMDGTPSPNAQAVVVCAAP
jgi:hypothetical protein